MHLRLRTKNIADILLPDDDMCRFLIIGIIMVFLFAHEQSCRAISKQDLFGTPECISAKVSPNGNTIAYVGADNNGIANVFILSKQDDFSKKKQISFFNTPDIIQFFWSAHSDKILLMKDENGTGRLHVHGIDVHSQEHIIYTEQFSPVNAKMIQVSSKKNSVVIGLNHRNPHFHDLYVLDLDSKDLTLLFENDAYAKFIVSDNLNLILKMKINADGSWTVFTAEDSVFMQLSAEEAFQTEFISYDEKKEAVYLLDNRFANTNQLIVKSLDLKQEKILGARLNSDVDEVLFINGEPKAYATYYTQKEWHIIDIAVEKDISFLQEQVGVCFEVINQSSGGEFWMISNSIPDEGTYFWIYDRKKQNLSKLHSPTLKEPLCKMYPMIVDARDGQKLICYYTLPKEHDQGGYVNHPVPLIVFPHGGPFKVRDKFEFNRFHQWLSSCGYAVLSINFRLSAGFGKAFVNAGNGEWGKKAHLDVLDAVESCIEKKITQKGKIGILGISYGGYESLAALTFTPNDFTCCTAICGPSNLKTVLDNVPQFWEFTSKSLSDRTHFFTKKAFITSMGGDPDQVEGINYLEQCSPLNFLQDIQAPLLLVHGQNDHVVVERESRQIYESMKKQNKEVSYILFPDEGHRFAKLSNILFYLDRVEFFLSKHLGGKYQPVASELLLHSSAKVLN